MLRHASTMAQYASDAYRDGIHGPWGVRKVSGERSGARVLVVTPPTKMVFAFRGTSNIYDWMANSQVELVRDLRISPKGRVHAGWAGMIDSVKDRLLPLAEMARRQGREIYVCGHSMGGALAAYFVAALANVKIRVDGLYMYGPPRPGDMAFCDYVSDNCPNAYRFVYGTDVVPLVPSAIRGYRHIGCETFYGRGMEIPTAGVDILSRLKAMARNAMGLRLFRSMVGDHLQYAKVPWHLAQE